MSEPIPSLDPTSNILHPIWAQSTELMTKAIAYLSESGSEKLTLRQTLFFLAVAEDDLRNISVNIVKVRERFPMIGRAIEKSKEQLMAPSRQAPDGLGWIYQVMDEYDRRQRWLHLTPKGKEVIAGLHKTLSS